MKKKTPSNRSGGAKPKQDLRRKHSAIIVDGPERAASRAMLHAVGFERKDFRKSQIGVASTWGMVTPCNMHINELSDHVTKGVDDNGGKGVIFNTITICFVIYTTWKDPC